VPVGTLITRVVAQVRVAAEVESRLSLLMDNLLLLALLARAVRGVVAAEEEVANVPPNPQERVVSHHLSFERAGV
jgi:hypothetical protein